jgi:multiple sugar transport system permease protein
MMKNRKDVPPMKEKLKDMRQAAINKYEQIKIDMKNPIKKAVLSKKIADRSSGILRGFIIFGLSFIILFPLFRQITLALRHPTDLNNPLIIWIPEQFSLLNFEISMNILRYWKALWNNVQVSTIVMILQIASTALAGYAFARLRFKGSNLLFWLVMLTLIVPPQTLSVSRMLYFKNFDILGIVSLFNNGEPLNLLGKISTLYLMAGLGMGIRSALFIYIFRQFFRGIPTELDESAQIDGAGVFRTFWNVMLPNARGAMLTVGLFAFVWQWNDVYFSRILAVSTSSFPLLTMQLANTSERLLHYLVFSGMEMLVGPDMRRNPLFVSLISNTSAFLMMLPVLIAYLFVQKYFVEGIERTGIVG